MKKCSLCKEVKNNDDFYTRQSRCKPCCRIISSNHYIKKKTNTGLYRTCTECKEVKDSNDFYNSRKKCKECTNNKEVFDPIWSFFEPGTEEYIHNYVMNEVIPFLEKEYKRINKV